MTEAQAAPLHSPSGCGCLLSALVTAPVLFVLFMAEVLGDCPPDYPCSKSVTLHVLLPAALLALAVGLPTKWLVGWWNRRQSARQSASMGDKADE